MTEISTKPYMLRAIHEWCTDNDYTPYVAVYVNVSYKATHDLRMDNDMITFAARFGGVVHSLEIPIANVLAIYAQENGQGMAFPVDREALEHFVTKAPSLISLVVTDKEDKSNDDPDPERPTPRRHLRVIK